MLDELDGTAWELYDIANDPTEAHDVAAAHPERVRELIDLWYAEAAKYKVLPLDGSMQQRLAVERPQTSRPRNRFVYYPNGSVIAPFACPPIFNRPFSIEADVEIPAGGAEGTLLAQGGNAGGHILFVKDGRLRYTQNYVGLQELEVVASEPLTEGRHTLRYEFEPTGPPDPRAGKGSPGRAQLYVDGTLVGNAEFALTTPFFFSIEGLSVGYDFGEPVLEGVAPPFAFTGTIHQVAVDVSGELIVDDEAEVARLMRVQ